MLATLFLALFNVASGLTTPEDRRAAVSISAESYSQLEELPAGHVPIVRRQHGVRKAASILGIEEEQPVIAATEGKQLPWQQHGYQKYPQIREDTIRDTDPCYVGKFLNHIGSYNQKLMPIEHNDCLNVLNFDRFTVQVTVQPTDNAPARSYVPLHFSGQAASADDLGISIGEGASRTSLRVALADGKNQDVRTFPFTLIDIGRHEVTYGLECWKTHGGRDCKVAINGTVQGFSQHFSNVAGNIYNLDGAAFGKNHDWTFAGYLRSLQVCPVSSGGGLEATTRTTTWVESAGKCAGRSILSETNKLAMCTEFNCDFYGLVHHPQAANMSCLYKHVCRDVYDKDWCCLALEPKECTIWVPTMYCAMSEEQRYFKYMRIRWPYCWFGPFGCLMNINIKNDGSHGFRALYTGFILFAVALFMICAWFCWSVIRTLYRNWKVNKLIKWMDEGVFLEVPEKISAESGLTCRALALQLRMMSQKLDGATQYDDFFPEVVILSPLGHREGLDAPGCGPGMYHALAVMTVLLKAGVACFSGLMVPADVEEKEVIDKLTEDKCKVFIVIQSEALYESWPSAVAIYQAQKHKIHHILPLAFDQVVPDWPDQWPEDSVPYSEDTKESEFLNMRLAVQRHYGVLSALPEAPHTVPTLPRVLEHIAKFIKGRLLALLDEHEYLGNVPEEIDIDMGNELQRVAKSLMTRELGSAWEQDYWPEVVLVFGHGSREDKDFTDCGPGMYAALGFTIAMMKAGIPVFSRLVCQTGFSLGNSVDGQVMEKITSSSSRCRLVIVVSNASLYSDGGALRQIHAIQEKKVPLILPLSFGGDIPELKDQWQNIKNGLDQEKIKMRKEVQARFCQLPCFPPPPATLLDKESDALPKAIQVIKNLVEQERKKAEEAEKLRKAEEIKKKAEEEQKKAEEEKKKAEEEKKKAEDEKNQAAATSEKPCFCGKCGTAFVSDAPFCRECGAKRPAKFAGLAEDEKEKAEEEAKQADLASEASQQEPAAAAAAAAVVQAPAEGAVTLEVAAAAAESSGIVEPTVAVPVPTAAGAETAMDIARSAEGLDEAPGSSVSQTAEVPTEHADIGAPAEAASLHAGDAAAPSDDADATF